MSVDPDILAIQRKRRQEGRCIACGVTSSPDTLCAEHRKTLAYCPVCETLYTRRPGTPPRDSSAYCTSCLSAQSRQRHTGRTRTEWRSDIGRRRRQLLPEIIKHYKRKEPIPVIATALGLTSKQLDKLIQAARRYGEWPNGLQRKPSRRKAHHGKPQGNTRDER